MHKEETDLKSQDFEEVEAITTSGNLGFFLISAFIITAFIIYKAIVH